MQNTNLLNNQLAKVLARRKLFDLLTRYDNHFDAESGHLDTHQEVGPGEMLWLAGDAVRCDQDSETHAAMPNFREKPRNLLAIDGVPPSFAFHEKEIDQGSKPSGIVIVLAGDVDLLSRKGVHLITRSDRDAGNALQQVTDQVLEGLALRRVGRRIVDDSQISMN